MYIKFKQSIEKLMKNLQILFLGFFVTIFCLLITRSVYAAPPPSAAQCEAMLQVTVTDMDFGTYLGGSSGTIVMDTTGAMTHIGVVPVGGTVGVAATYDLVAPGKNCNKRNITFTMPTSITINNISGSPATTITITNLVTDLPSNPFQVRNVSTIRIGGTLNATAGDAKAPYTGPFDVSFTF